MEQKKSSKILTILGIIILCGGLVWIGMIFWGFDKKNHY